MPDHTVAHDPQATTGGDDTDFAVAGPPAAGPHGFELLAEVGRGGMGVVHRAHDLLLDREVAVKLLHERYAGGSVAAARFVGEARVTARLQHPGIPAVYHVGEWADGRPFLAMKLIRGHTLADQPPAAGAVAGLFEAVCQAVGYAHAQGVVHRDLKPANVMVGAFGEVQVMDWGLAKPLGAADPTAVELVGAADAREDGATLTQAGSVLGTPAYMPPEQAVGDLARIDRRADVFALGGVLCWLLTGRPPYDGTDAGTVRGMAAHGDLADTFDRLDACGADPGLVGLCRRCLAADPAGRPADAGEVAAEVGGLRAAADDRARRAETAAAEEQVRRRLYLRLGGLAAAVLLLGVAGTAAGLVRATAARRTAEAAQLAEAAERQAADAARAEAVAKRTEAEAKAAESSAMVRFFSNRVFAAARPKGQEGGLGFDVTLRSALAAAVPRLTADFAAQPLVEARLRLVLGATFGMLEDGPAAAGLFERAVELRRQHLGPDHPDTLGAENDLAIAASSLGRHPEALRLQERVRAVAERVLGPDHVTTLRYASNLGSFLDAAGRPAEALAVREQVLAARRRVQPPDDPNLLQAVHGLAVSYLAAGRPADAVRLEEEAEAGRLRVFGPDHPETLHARLGLARAYLAAGRPADAVRQAEGLPAASRRAFGADHVRERLSLAVLADCYDAAGRPADALRARQDELAACRRAAPADPFTRDCLLRVAGSLVAVGRVAEAVPLVGEAVRWPGGGPADAELAPFRGRPEFRAALPELAPPPRPAAVVH